MPRWGKLLYRRAVDNAQRSAGVIQSKLEDSADPPPSPPATTSPLSTSPHAPPAPLTSPSALHPIPSKPRHPLDRKSVV